MDGEVVATGLQFPEGPVWLDDSLLFTEVEGGVVTRWSAGALTPVATTGGGPNGAALGPDGALYVTQNGGMGAGPRGTPGIQRVDLDTGAVELLATAVAGIVLEGPNDLALGPDGRMWFTDPRGASDPERNDRPGRLFALDVTSGEGELVREVGPVFPNGIGFLADDTLVWTESFSRRVMALVDGDAELIVELPERHFPDGFCVGADGKLYVASTYGHCVSVIEDGTIVDRLMCGDGMPTNCCFGGADLYVTESRRHTLWRFPAI